MNSTSRTRLFVQLDFYNISEGATFVDVATKLSKPSKHSWHLNGPLSLFIDDCADMTYTCATGGNFASCCGCLQGVPMCYQHGSCYFSCRGTDGPCNAAFSTFNGPTCGSGDQHGLCDGIDGRASSAVNEQCLLGDNTGGPEYTNPTGSVIVTCSEVQC